MFNGFVITTKTIYAVQLHLIQRGAQINTMLFKGIILCKLIDQHTQIKLNRLKRIFEQLFCSLQINRSTGLKFEVCIP